MKLGKFIVMFVGCVAFFAILFPPLVECRLQATTTLGLKSYIQVPSLGGFDEPMFPSLEEDDPFPPLASSPQRDVQKETFITRGYNAIGYNAMNADADAGVGAGRQLPGVNIEIEMADVLEFIECEIENSGKINANETKELLNNVKSAMKGQPFVPTYASKENMDLLEECVKTVEFIYGWKCEQLKVKIAQIKSILFQ